MVYRFEECELDEATLQLRVGGEPVQVEPQVFDLLLVLVRQRDRVVTKEELLDEVWHHRFVTESAVSSRVKSARRAIGVAAVSPLPPRDFVASASRWRLPGGRHRAAQPKRRRARIRAWTEVGNGADPDGIDYNAGGKP